MNPQFRLIGDGINLQENTEFWVPPEATHISFKNGLLSFWVLCNPPQPNNFKSTNNRRFIEKKGNTFFLPEFKYFIGRGHHYGRIHWHWRCVRCLKRFRREELNKEEICLNCFRI